MSDEERPLAEFIEAEGITAEVEWADENPNAIDEWPPDARHFLVTLKRSPARTVGSAELLDGRWSAEQAGSSSTLAVPFSQGSGHTEEPTAADVLDCLASDGASVENARSFDDWAVEYGYDTDSRRAFATYETCQRQARELREWLGDEATEALLWNTERL